MNFFKGIIYIYLEKKKALERHPITVYLVKDIITMKMVEIKDFSKT